MSNEITSLAKGLFTRNTSVKKLSLVLVTAAIWGYLAPEYLLNLSSTALTYALLALSVGFLAGFAGLFSFGHAALFGSGAYITMLLTAELSIPYPVAILGTALIVSVVGYLFAIPAVRTNEIYFAIVTLAFNLIIVKIPYVWPDLLGGEDGRTGLVSFTPDAYYWVILVTVLVTYLVFHRIINSPFGGIMTSIGENRQRVSFLGYDPKRFERIAFGLSSGVAGLSGALYAHHTGFVFPTYLSFHLSGEALLMVIIGGLGTLVGPVIGGVVITIGEYVITEYTSHWQLFFGATLMIVIIFSPTGLYPILLNLQENPGESFDRLREAMETYRKQIRQ